MDYRLLSDWGARIPSLKAAYSLLIGKGLLLAPACHRPLLLLRAIQVTRVPRSAWSQARAVSASMVSVGFWVPCEGKQAPSVT